MTYQIISAPIEITPPTPPTEFTTQVTTKVTLPNGGSTTAPIANTSTQIIAASVSLRSVFVYNKGPGTVHLYIGDPASGWLTAPQSARRIAPGGYAESSLDSCKLSLTGWSEGAASELIVDVLT